MNVFRVQKKAGWRGREGNAQPFGGVANRMGCGHRPSGQGCKKMGHRFMPSREQGRMGREQDQAASQFGNRRFQRKTGVAMPPGNEAAEIGVAFGRSDQRYGPVPRAGLRDFGAHDGCDALGAACVQKWPEAVQVVGIGEGDPVVSPSPGDVTDFAGRGGAPHERVVGAGGEGDQSTFSGNFSLIRSNFMIFCLNSVFPITRFSMEMHHRNDKNFVVVFSV